MDIKARRPGGLPAPGQSASRPQQIAGQPAENGHFRKKSFKDNRWKYMAIGAAVLVTLLVVFGLIWNIGSFYGIDKSRYQAVTVREGDAVKRYFGKLSKPVFGGDMRLQDVYYLKDNGSAPQPNSGSPTLIKHGTELWAPEDVLYIHAENVIYWENLKDSGKIAEAIRNYQSR